MRRLLGLIAASTVWVAAVAPAAACSPPLNQNLRELGPEQVVVVGTTGEPVAGGRLFHVERAFNGVDTTPILIAFKEGEPIGDCSYPVQAGTRLIIAPWRDPDGTLRADLGTLQADPDSEDGQRYVAEATDVFGPGIVPDAAPLATADGMLPNVAIAGAVLLGLVVTAGVAIRRRASEA